MGSEVHSGYLSVRIHVFGVESQVLRGKKVQGCYLVGLHHLPDLPDELGQLFSQQVRQIKTRLKSKNNLTFKVFSGFFAFIENGAITLTTVALVYTVTKGRSKKLLIYFFSPTAVSIIGKCLLQFLTSKVDDGLCSLLLFKLLTKMLFYFGGMLALSKISDDKTDGEWRQVLVPLWIVLVIYAVIVLMSLMFFLFKLVTVFVVGKSEVTDLVMGFWALINIGGLGASNLLFMMKISKNPAVGGGLKGYFEIALGSLLCAGCGLIVLMFGHRKI